MDPWIYWVIIGIVCLIVEIFTPNFFFMSIGISAIITGVIALMIPSLAFQLLIFCLVSFVTFVYLKKFSGKLFSLKEETNFFALKNKTGYVTETILSNKKGYVKVEGEEWAAVSEDSSQIEENKKVVVKNIDGNKLIVNKIEGE